LLGEVAYQARTFATAEYVSYGAGAGLELGSGLDVVSGARLLLGELERRPAFYGFVQLSLGAARGAWRPAVGLELEAVSDLRPASDPEDITGSLTRNVEAREGATIRAGLVMTPLRAEIERCSFEVGSLRLSTPLDDDAGQWVYVGVTVVRVGWPL
jgi:hypothetical protein